MVAVDGIVRAPACSDAWYNSIVVVVDNGPALVVGTTSLVIEVRTEGSVSARGGVKCVIERIASTGIYISITVSQSLMGPYQGNRRT